MIVSVTVSEVTFTSGLSFLIFWTILLTPILCKQSWKRCKNQELRKKLLGRHHIS